MWNRGYGQTMGMQETNAEIAAVVAGSAAEAALLVTLTATVTACQAAAGTAQAAANTSAAALAQLNAEFLLGSISPDVSNELAGLNGNILTLSMGGYQTPNTLEGCIAGAKALANQLTLEYQAGTISQAQLTQALATLTPVAGT